MAHFAHAGQAYSSVARALFVCPHARSRRSFTGSPRILPRSNHRPSSNPERVLAGNPHARMALQLGGCRRPGNRLCFLRAEDERAGDVRMGSRATRGRLYVAPRGPPHFVADRKRLRFGARLSRPFAWRSIQQAPRTWDSAQCAGRTSMAAPSWGKPVRAWWSGIVGHGRRLAASLFQRWRWRYAHRSVLYQLGLRCTSAGLDSLWLEYTARSSLSAMPEASMR